MSYEEGKYTKPEALEIIEKMMANAGWPPEDRKMILKALQT